MLNKIRGLIEELMYKPNNNTYDPIIALHGTKTALKKKYGRWGLTDDDIKRGHWNGYEIVVLPDFNVEEVM